jgi:HprK-related kinase A
MTAAGTVSRLDGRTIAARLRSDAGLSLRTGPFAASLRSPLPEVAAAVARLYADYPLLEEDDFVDFRVGVRRPAGLRRVWQPQVTFELDGQAPFNPLPGNQGFPLLEWGLNWCVYGLCHQFLTLHAAVLERNGRALILPAPSGSGKSTLCAGLLFGGWRLLSDELTLICPKQGDIVPIPRPVSLKNQSIAVIERLVPQVQFGSRVSETSKGVVAHFRPPAEALRQAHQRALPGWVVLPKYVPEQPATLQPMEKSRAFMHLVENAFNYDVFGAEGFQLLGSVVDRSPCFSFEYGHLPEAVQLFNRLADGQDTTTPI